MLKRIKLLLGKSYRYIFFIFDFLKFRRLALKQDTRFIPKWRNHWAFLYDKTDKTFFSTHYVYHPAWAARVITKINPAVHIDISSTLHFSTIVSAFIPVKFYDYRPAHLNLSGLSSGKSDLTKLPFEDNSQISVSCMHTLEHIGLGRYGDPIDPKADLRAIDELKRVTATGGSLIIAVPVGKQKLIFNAHRIYSYSQIISYFDGFELKEYALIPDNALETGIVYNATKEQTDRQNYGCGCFWFIKR